MLASLGGPSGRWALTQPVPKRATERGTPSPSGSRCDDVHASTTGHVATSGRTAISLPKIPCTDPNQRENLVFMDHQNMEPPNCMVPKVGETEVSQFRSCTLCVQGPKFGETTPCVVLTRGWFSQGGGGVNFLVAVQRRWPVPPPLLQAPPKALKMTVSLGSGDCARPVTARGTPGTRGANEDTICHVPRRPPAPQSVPSERRDMRDCRTLNGNGSSVKHTLFGHDICTKPHKTD